MSEVWRIVIVLLAAGFVVEAVLLVAVMRQVGELLLHGGPSRTNVPAGPKLGTVIDVAGREDNGRPALVVFTSSGCEHCEAIEPALERIHAVYGPDAPNGYQLDLVAVLTDRDATGRQKHAERLGGFARTDLTALMQDWDIPGTPFAVALDSKRRVKGAEVVNGRTQLEMLAVEKLGLVWVASPEATVDASSLAIQHVGGSSSEREVLP